MDASKKQSASGSKKSSGKKIRPKVAKNRFEPVPTTPFVSNPNFSSQATFNPIPTYSTQPTPPSYPMQPGFNQGFNPENISPLENLAYQNHPFREPRRIETDSEEDEFQSLANLQRHEGLDLDDYDDVRDDDDVQEEPVQEAGSSKAKGKRTHTNRAQKTPWTPREEVELVKAYLHCSENKTVGNQQPANSFYLQVLEHFKALMGGTNRTKDQVMWKWKDTNKKITLFNGFFIQAKQSAGSGTSDIDHQTAALNAHKARTGKAFGHLECWKIARNHAKWVPSPLPGEDIVGVGPSSQKKQKTSESTNFSNDTEGFTSRFPDMDLNNDPENVDDTTPTRQQRPGRKTSTPESSSATKGVIDAVGEWKAKRIESEDDKMLQRRKVADAIIKKEETATNLMMKQQKNMDMKLFFEDHNKLEEPNRSILIQRKREIAEEYGWPFDP